MPLLRFAIVLATLLVPIGLPPARGADLHLEQRNEVDFLRGPYNLAFFSRHNESFRYSAAFHYHHGKLHDVLQTTPLGRHTAVDQEFDADVVLFTLRKKARTEPTMELFGPYTAQFAWRLYRAIDWTHMHHEQTYDILSERSIAWNRKKPWTDRAVRYYVEKNDVAFSTAPLDVTMRRAGVMMKPYFTYARTYYPRATDFAYVAHWWHPVVYEAMMIAGNDDEQHPTVAQVNDTMVEEVFATRPQRMLLSREIMPRYARFSPESANVFDNLHMLHGIAFDIMAYEGWTPAEKRAELYRVVEALGHQPGDEQLARKFTLPRPGMDPRVYEPWMRGYEGEMTRIMEEMMVEMLPMMMPGGMSDAQRRRMWTQFRMKLSPDFEPGEIPGSLHDAMMAVMPDMRMMPGTMEPGQAAPMMVEAMLAGWRKKYGDLPDVPPMPMDAEPSAPALGAARERRR
jgi:hypothetical protein